MEAKVTRQSQSVSRQSVQFSQAGRSASATISKRWARGMRPGRRGVGHITRTELCIFLAFSIANEAHSANAFNSAHACMQGRRKIRCGDGGAGLPRSRLGEGMLRFTFFFSDLKSL